MMRPKSCQGGTSFRSRPTGLEQIKDGPAVRQMRTVFAYPGNLAHAQHIALALYEIGSRLAFVTTFAFRPEGAALASC